LYTLRIPFQLPPGQEIDGSFSTQLGNLVIEVCQEGSRYVLTVEGLESQQAAEDYLQAIWAGLMWVLLQRNLAFQVHMTLQGVVWIPGPIDNFFGTGRKVTEDGAIDVKRPMVYPSGRKLLKSEAFPVTAVISTRASIVCDVLLEGLSFPYAASVISDRKLMIAIELYEAFWTESSQSARFLTLVMALEALATSSPRPPRVLALLEEWVSQLEEMQNQGDLDSDESGALDSLKHEIFFRKEDSIRSQIRSLVYDTLSKNGDADASEMAKKAVAVYDRRSTLVHEGFLPDSELSDAIRSAQQIVARVLKARFLTVASDPHE
jgi:hypothetical protein